MQKIRCLLLSHLEHEHESVVVGAKQSELPYAPGRSPDHVHCRFLAVLTVEQ
jgi:hypothetical protein